MTRKNIKVLDKLWSKRIRKYGICTWCGKRGNTQGGHIFSRSNYSTRWDLENGTELCYSCNCFRQPKNPIEFTRWVEGWMGKAKLEKLRKKARKIVKGQDFEEIKKKLEEIL